MIDEALLTGLFLAIYGGLMLLVGVRIGAKRARSSYDMRCSALLASVGTVKRSCLLHRGHRGPHLGGGGSFGG